MLYGFADFELDTTPLTLRRLGKPIALETPSLKRLACLLQHRATTVSQADLLAAGGSQAISDQAVHNAILEIRKALDDSGKEQRFIQSKRSAGYRFGWQAVCQWQDATERDIKRAGITEYIRAREFQSLIEAWTRDFVGREFIFRAIDHHVHDTAFPSGYIVIRGEPGIGKTALLAELVKRYGYVHHFNIALQNIRAARDFLSNVCAQLLVQYHLPRETLPPAADRDSGFLSVLLTEVAAQQAGHPVLILVDALDEAEVVGLATRANRLYLPAALPEGVFFVVTMRDDDDCHLMVDRRRDIYLRDDDPQNYDDICQYIQRFLREHAAQMTAQLGQTKLEDAEFVKILAEKSEGNFMYLVHVLRDLREGQLTVTTIDDIHQLPQGLRSYYQQHWRVMRAQDVERFEKYYEPVVCMLATVREPVSVAQVAEWTKLVPQRVQEVIHQWRAFLNDHMTQQNARLYRIYHASFQDFLAEEVGLGPYHDNIAQMALDKIRW